MRLEDASLYLVLDHAGLACRQPAEFCREAIAGGVDILDLRTGGAASDSARSLAETVAGLCRSEDAIFVTDNAALTASVRAHGVRLDGLKQALPEARTLAGPGTVAGVHVSSPEEAQLAIETGADFLLVGMESREKSKTGSEVRRMARVPVYAAGIVDSATADNAIGLGFFRLCVHASALAGSNVKEAVAAFSRMLGRHI